MYKLYRLVYICIIFKILKIIMCIWILYIFMCVWILYICIRTVWKKIYDLRFSIKIDIYLYVLIFGISFFGFWDGYSCICFIFCFVFLRILLKMCLKSINYYLNISSIIKYENIISLILWMILIRLKSVLCKFCS